MTTDHERVVMCKLTEPQRKAFEKLTDKFQSAYTLQAGINTLDALVSKGLAVKIVGIGSMFSPRTAFAYKRST